MSDMLGAWGRWVYRFRWWLLAASALSLAPASVILIQGAQLEAGTMLTTTESGRAASLMARQLPGQPVSFELILSSATLRATDRAFRIGQTKNVLVHKFVCRGTVEEKIDQLIDSKRQLSQDLLEGGGEVLLTEMRDDDLLKLVALDLHTASME